ncbi:hypothetical protein ELR49_24340 (plasmid) [Shigella sonnei]|nr:hypothetical protein ELR49_24340 [Shigella sonnei]
METAHKNNPPLYQTKDHTDDISFILYQGRLEQRGHNYTIIKSKANSVILLLKMLLTNKI